MTTTTRFQSTVSAQEYLVAVALGFRSLQFLDQKLLRRFRFLDHHPAIDRNRHGQLLPHRRAMSVQRFRQDRPEYQRNTQGAAT
jgi:hypothetical protein